MAKITVNETASFVSLDINASGSFANANVAMADTANVLTVPALQDVTINATPGTFTWEQLDSLSQQVVTTPSTNSLDMNMVLDDTAFFTGAGSTLGLWDITNNKTKAYFRLNMNGESAGDFYIEGEGYLSGLAMTVSPTAPVWVSPMSILVDGNYVQSAYA
jgi:hypothetical protein